MVVVICLICPFLLKVLGFTVGGVLSYVYCIYYVSCMFLFDSAGHETNSELLLDVDGLGRLLLQAEIGCLSPSAGRDVLI